MCCIVIMRMIRIRLFKLRDISELLSVPWFFRYTEQKDYADNGNHQRQIASTGPPPIFEYKRPLCYSFRQ